MYNFAAHVVIAREGAGHDHPFLAWRDPLLENNGLSLSGTGKRIVFRRGATDRTGGAQEATPDLASLAAGVVGAAASFHRAPSFTSRSPCCVPPTMRSPAF